MKKILLALFVMCSALSFSAKVIKSSNIEVKGNVVYEAGQNAPYTGVLENYDEKGVLDARAEFKNGVMDGYSKLYYPSGKVFIEENYKNGERDGVAKAYDENGKLMQQATFKNGQQVK